MVSQTVGKNSVDDVLLKMHFKDVFVLLSISSARSDYLDKAHGFEYDHRRLITNTAQCLHYPLCENLLSEALFDLL
jgi:hypothetical protein